MSEITDKLQLICERGLRAGDTKIIREAIGLIETYGAIAAEATTDLKKLRERNAELEAQVSKWISVEDELPPVDTLFWGFNGVSICLYERVWWERGHTYYRVDDCPHMMVNSGEVFYDSVIDDEYKITKWMRFYMPQPPTEQDNG